LYLKYYTTLLPLMFACPSPRRHLVIHLLDPFVFHFSHSNYFTRNNDFPSAFLEAGPGMRSLSLIYNVTLRCIRDHKTIAFSQDLPLYIETAPETDALSAGGQYWIFRHFRHSRIKPAYGWSLNHKSTRVEVAHMSGDSIFASGWSCWL